MCLKSCPSVYSYSSVCPSVCRYERYAYVRICLRMSVCTVEPSVCQSVCLSVKLSEHVTYILLVPSPATICTMGISMIINYCCGCIYTRDTAHHIPVLPSLSIMYSWYSIVYQSYKRLKYLVNLIRSHATCVPQQRV